MIPDFLWHSAEAYGFRGDAWTCERVTDILGEEFSIAYSKSQVPRLLKGASRILITLTVHRYSASDYNTLADKLAGRAEAILGGAASETGAGRRRAAWRRDKEKKGFAESPPAELQ